MQEIPGHITQGCLIMFPYVRQPTFTRYGMQDKSAGGAASQGQTSGLECHTSPLVPKLSADHCLVISLN